MTTALEILDEGASAALLEQLAEMCSALDLHKNQKGKWQIEYAIPGDAWASGPESRDRKLAIVLGAKQIREHLATRP